MDLQVPFFSFFDFIHLITETLFSYYVFCIVLFSCFKVTLSFFEIYGGRCQDLLNNRNRYVLAHLPTKNIPKNVLKKEHSTEHSKEHTLVTKRHAPYIARTHCPIHRLVVREDGQGDVVITDLTEILVDTKSSLEVSGVL